MTRGEEGGRVWGKGKGQVKAQVQRIHEQRQWGYGEEIECGRWEWVGQGRVMGEDWGQLYLNNNKKIKISVV